MDPRKPHATWGKLQVSRPDLIKPPPHPRAELVLRSFKELHISSRKALNYTERAVVELGAYVSPWPPRP